MSRRFLKDFLPTKSPKRIVFIFDKDMDIHEKKQV